MRTLQRALREQYTVIRDYPHGVTINIRESGDQCFPILSFELAKLWSIDDPCDHLSHVVRLLPIQPDYSINFVDRM